MRQGWRIARIGGIDVRVDAAFVVIAVLFGWWIWTQLVSPLGVATLGWSAALALSLFAVALAFLSILLHELAHAAICRLRGIHVDGITLMLTGGATHARLDSRGPLDEFLATAAGPVTSLLLGVLLVALSRFQAQPLSLVVGGTDPTRAIIALIGGWNVVLGLFNLVPGFPLDGGRLLRSLLWRATGDVDRATRIAARIGQAVGLAIAGLGLVRGLPTRSLGWLWLVLIGFWLFQAARSAVTDTRRREHMRGMTVRDAMVAAPPTVFSATPIREATQRLLAGHEGEAFPVVDPLAGGVVGFVSATTVAGVDGDRPVRDAMSDASGSIEAHPDEPLESLLARLVDRGGHVGVVLVVEAGRLAGVIEPDDLRRALDGRRR